MISVRLVEVPRSSVAAQRDDGWPARGLGALVAGQLPPLPPVLVGVFVTGVLLAVGAADAGAVFVPLVLLLLIGPGGSHPHDGRLDWLVPPLLRLIEYGFTAVLGFAQGVPPLWIFALLGAVLFHHYDVVYRVRQRVYPPSWLALAGLGWDGRMVVVALGALIGGAPVVYALLALYLWGLFAWESLTCWLAVSGPGAGAADLGAEE